MKVAFATTCKNRLADLKETLPAMLACKSRNFDLSIVVADYGCTEGTSKFVALYSNCYSVRSNQEFYRYSHAKNIAGRFAAENLAVDYIVFCDADICPYPWAVSQAVGELIKHDVDYVKWIYPLPPSWGSCSIFAIRADVYLAVKGFDEALTTYGHDDTNLFIRLEKAKYTFKTLSLLDCFRMVNNSGNCRHLKETVSPDQIQKNLEYSLLDSDVNSTGWGTP